MIKKNLILFLSCIVFNSFSQEIKKGVFHPEKIGFLYNYASNENYILNDSDYSYSTKNYKVQFFYPLGTYKKIDFELIVQPQIQFLEHQLLNEQFVRPEEVDFHEKRVEFTESKYMNLYALEVGFSAKKRLFKKLDLQGTISLGLAIIDTRTERLAKGFTFIENFSIGLSYQTSKKTFLYTGMNLGHVSNAELSQPNSGYNVSGFELGLSYLLN